jgi:hypothetical protein
MVRLATSWTVMGSNPDGRMRFSLLHTRPDWHWGPPSLFYKEYWGSCSRVQRPRRGVDHPPPPHLATRLRIGGAIALHGMLQGEPCLQVIVGNP